MYCKFRFALRLIAERIGGVGFVIMVVCDWLVIEELKVAMVNELVMGTAAIGNWQVKLLGV
jgi:hypothetical protein